MFMFLSHPLDPKDLAWPGEPVVKTRQCTDVCEATPFASFVSELPNHFGTHMDAPRHFVKDGLNINQLPMEYFCHEEVAVLDIPKGLAEGVTKEDLIPFADVLGRISAALIRTGLERYRTEEPTVYQHEGSYIAPSAGDYLTETFPQLRVIGMQWVLRRKRCRRVRRPYTAISICSATTQGNSAQRLKICIFRRFRRARRSCVSSMHRSAS